MPQEDYLKKQFDRLARMLGKILADVIGLKYTIDLNQDLEIVTEINDTELGFNLREIIDLPNESFIEQITTKHHFNNENLELLADIFLVIVEKSSNSDQIRYRKQILAEKCILIWEYLEKSESAYSLDRNLKMERIRTYLV